MLLVAAPGLPALDGRISVFDPDTAGFLPNVFEGLVRFKPETCAVEPCLATEWRLSPDGRTLTFQLRRNVHFHDGQKLTAALVTASFEQTLRDGSPYLFGMVESVTSPDPHSVVFHLKKPYTPFLRTLALPQAAVSLPGRPPSGTGPFRIKAADDREVVLSAFQDHWDGPPVVETVSIKSVPDPGRRAALMHKHHRVIALDVPCSATGSPSGGTTAVTTAASLNYLGFYTGKSPFDNPAARRAVALALDRHSLCNQLFCGLIAGPEGLLPPVVLDGLNSQPQTFDPAAARDLASAAGLNGKTLTLLTYKGTRPYNPAGGERLADEVKRQLQAAGMEVRVRCYEWESLKKAITRREGDFFIYGWVSDNGDPDNFLYCLLSGSPSTRGFNTTGYENPVVNLMLSRAQQVPDSAVRDGIYRHALEILDREAPLVTLNYGAHIAAVSPGLQGFAMNPTGTYDLTRIILKN
jgi:peptide/nickel transport system substrate-binding protein